MKNVVLKILKILFGLLGIRFTKPLNGHVGQWYEQECCRMLKRQRFKKIHTTKSTQDQGADILAYKKRKWYAVQCKYYSTPVGNKAVQEAYAAKAYYECDCAMVMTNTTFTKSAKELAEKLEVELLGSYKARKGIVSSIGQPVWYHLQSLVMLGVAVWLCIDNGLILHDNTVMNIRLTIGAICLGALMNRCGYLFVATVFYAYGYLWYMTGGDMHKIIENTLLAALILSLLGGCISINNKLKKGKKW